MSSKDVLDCARQEGPVPKGISLKVMEGSRDGDLVEQIGVSVHGGVNKLVSDNDQLMFKVAVELDREQSRGEGHDEAMVGNLDIEIERIVVFAGGFCFPFMLSMGQCL